MFSQPSAPGHAPPPGCTSCSTMWQPQQPGERRGGRGEGKEVEERERRQKRKEGGEGEDEEVEGKERSLCTQQVPGAEPLVAGRATRH